jgi:hypothetical protein
VLISAPVKKSYAHANHVLIEHTLRDEWYFGTFKIAALKLQEIEKHYILEENHGFKKTTDGLYLWIKSYGLSPEDRTRGLMGHYAHIYITKGDDGFWTLRAKKYALPLTAHPMKNKRSRFPSWSNPIIKEILSGKIYATAAQAQDALQALHEGYPEASTPGVGKLSISISAKNGQGESTKQQCIFLTAPHPDGGVVITKKELPLKKPSARKTAQAHPRIGTKKTKLPKVRPHDTLTQEQPAAPALEPSITTPTTQPVQIATAEPPKKKGYFTSMIEMKKKQPR